jgi:hypothetical protein
MKTALRQTMHNTWSSMISPFFDPTSMGYFRTRRLSLLPRTLSGGEKRPQSYHSSVIGALLEPLENCGAARPHKITTFSSHM